MVEKGWKQNKKYENSIIKEYEHWTLEVCYRQHTLGSYIIFAKRKVEKISQLTKKELFELREVMNEIENVLLKNEPFKPDRFNYLQLGNALHQLHFHCIPRYSSKKRFLDMDWVDISFGTVPTWSKEEKEVELVMKIKDKLVELFEE